MSDSNSEQCERLRPRWDAVVTQLGITAGDGERSFAWLVKSYRAANRYYHDLKHIEQCLQCLDELRSLCDHPAEVEWAIWYHDVVYDATRHDNEEQSATDAQIYLYRSHVNDSVCQRVGSLILATKHSAVPQGADQAVMIDADLSILGRPRAEFEAYETAIRLEYAHVDEASFCAGRAALLQRFLDRATIYNTASMREKYESAARENLARSIEQLKGNI